MIKKVTSSSILKIIFCFVFLLTSTAYADNDSELFNKSYQAIEKQDFKKAKALLNKLLKKHPNNPEIYNNLAYIAIQSKDFKQAELLLKEALQSNPIYQSIYENLSEIFKHQALVAYNEILEGENPTLPKLTLFNQFQPQVQSPILLADNSKPKQEKPKQEQEKPKQEKPIAPQVLINTEIPTVVEKKNNEPKQAISQKSLKNNLNAWKTAWSQGDSKAYINLYSPDFKPKQFASHQAWTSDRQRKIKPSKKISIQIENLSIAIQGQTAITSFRQIYKSSNYSDVTSKTLRWQYQNDRWVIVSEVIQPHQKSLKSYLNTWKTAWSQGDSKAYINLYSPDFKPKQFASHQAWTSDRQRKIKPSKKISIQIENLSIAIQGQTAITSFRQIYKSSNYSDVTSKTLRWQYQNDRWVIVNETSS